MTTLRLKRKDCQIVDKIPASAGETGNVPGSGVIFSGLHSAQGEARSAWRTVVGIPMGVGIVSPDKVEVRPTNLNT